MKATELLMIGLVICAAGAFPVSASQPAAVDKPRRARVNVLELQAVPDGNFLVNLKMDGQERLVNFKVQDNEARCVNSSIPRLKGMQGKFQLIGNGVFLVFFQNENHRASQFWVFREDGSAAVKEVPDRGEKQVALPVASDSLELPGKVKALK